jgi:4-hydroxybenzoate polyprenyltransferase
MNLSVALRLGRVSNLPTVTSNVLAAVALTRVQVGAGQIVALCVAMSLFYVGGMWLNDAYDREIDRRERPERPIPSGQVDAATVFGWGFAMLAAGIGLIAALALVEGGGGTAVLSSIALALLIVFYDLHHKGNPWSPLVMGLCRAGVYATAALSVSGELSSDVLIGGGALVAYLIGLTYIAKQENLRELGNLWPLGFLAGALVAAWPATRSAWGAFVTLAARIGLALLDLRERRIKAAVTSLIAGISLLDTMLIANTGTCGELALIALACFPLTLLLQRYVPGT